MACKEYSAVFLSLRINKDKTPVRVKSLTQLNVCPMLNLKGRGVMGGSSSNFFFLSFFSRDFSDRCALLWMCQRSGWPHQSISSPAFFWQFWAVNIKKSSAYHRRCEGWKGSIHTPRAERALQPRLWLWSDTSSQK